MVEKDSKGTGSQTSLNTEHSASTSIGTHGGNIISMAIELGCPVTDLIDMSSNLTPLGMVPGLKDMLIDKLDEISYLPETASHALIDAFSRKYGLQEGQVVAGNGTTEFIYGVPASLGLERAVIVNPTYSDYQLACSWAGMTVTSFDLMHREGFALDLNKLSDSLTGGELVFICNPNNPTGWTCPSKDLHAFALAHRESMFLVDESYLPFLNEPSLFEFPLPENLFILCSFSKIYGIPGLRLGFLVSQVQNMTQLAKRLKPWGVNRMAQVAGEFLITHGDAYVNEVRDFLAQQRPAFAQALGKLPGVEVIPGKANFILCCLSGNVRAEYLREKMLEHRIMIRNCSNFAGLDDRYFRLSLKGERENAFCLEMLDTVLGDAA